MRRTRTVILAIANVVLVGRIAMILLTGGAEIRVPDLLEQQIIQRDDLNANTCERAVLLASNPNATLLTSNNPNLIDPRTATLIADATLENHFHTKRNHTVITTDPMLMTAPFFREERVVWGRLWLPEEGNGAVVYVDAMAAVPLLLFTDINVKDLTNGCVFSEPINHQKQAKTLAPLMMGLASTFIAAGIVIDYRHRIRRFTLRKRP